MAIILNVVKIIKQRSNLRVIERKNQNVNIYA